MTKTHIQDIYCKKCEYIMTKKTLTLSIDNKVYEQLQKFKKKNPEFNTSYRVEKFLIGEMFD